MTEPLDQVAVEALSAQLLRAIRAHYQSRPTARTTALEVLNALASTTAMIMASTDDKESIKFFQMALAQQLIDELERQQEGAPWLQ